MTGKYSLDIKTPIDFLKKLEEEYQSFELDKLSSRHAINCAMTAWHLVDWVWAGRIKADPFVLRRKNPSQPIFAKKGGDERFKKHVISLCPDLEIMQCITNGSKHFGQSNSKVRSTELEKGAFSQAFSRGFDISLLEIELDDGSTVGLARPPGYRI